MIDQLAKDLFVSEAVISGLGFQPFTVEGKPCVADGKRFLFKRNGQWTARTKTNFRGMLSNKVAKSRLWVCESAIDVMAFAHVGEFAAHANGIAEWPDLEEVETIYVLTKDANIPGKHAVKAVMFPWLLATKTKSPSQMNIDLKGNADEFISKLESAISSVHDTLVMADGLDPFNTSDIAIADYIHKAVKGSYKYEPSLGTWFVWNDTSKRWLTGDISMKRLISSYLRVKADTTHSMDGRNKILSNHKVACVEKTLKYLYENTSGADKFNTATNLLLTGSGVVDLTTSELSENDQSFMLTQEAAALYEKRTEGPWHDHINSVFMGDIELARYFQKLVGYSITGETKERVFFVLVGNGRNGKSVTINTLKHILGTYASAMPFDLLTKPITGAPTPSIMHLKNSRFVMISECDSGSAFSEATIKVLTGNDVISVRGLYDRVNTQFVPQAKIWLALNALPAVKDITHSFWDRVRIIPFDKRFSKDEVDLNIQSKFMANSEEVLSWAIEGARLYYQEGISHIPDACKQYVAQYREREDWLEGFLAETFYPEIEKESWIDLYKIMERYEEWSRIHAFTDAIGSKTMSKLLCAKGIMKRRSQTGMRFLVRKEELN